LLEGRISIWGVRINAKSGRSDAVPELQAVPEVDRAMRAVAQGLDLGGRLWVKTGLTARKGTPA